MWSWIKGLFCSEPKPPPPPRQVEVGRADVHIVEVDGSKHDIYFEGDYAGEHPFGGDWVFDAEFRFDAWRERAGRTGMASVGGNRYVPLCNIKSIDVEYSKKHVEVEQ